MGRKRLAEVAVLAALGSALAWCATPSPSRVILEQTPLTRLEGRLGRMRVHLSEFSPVSAPLAVPRCGDVRPPEALATPDPLLQVDNANLRVRVSFIVGADGRVHSAFVLDSGGPAEDQVVLRAIHRWRYRPALCNGVPTDSETRVQFGIR